MIRPVDLSDAAAICDIYNYYIENTTISFEEKPVGILEIEERIRTISANYPYLVSEEDSGPGAGMVTGFAYANAWKTRSAYRFSAELSIYIRKDFQGRGMGTVLFGKLLEELRKMEIHSVVSGIVLPNDRSVALNEKAGFKKIGQFEQIGFKFNRWHDVGYWELILK